MPRRHHPAAPASPTRKLLRLPGFDYARPGAYFVTIVTKGRACLLGTAADDTVHLNAAGRAVDDLWKEIPSRHDGTGVDAHIVMPNHVHGIITLTNSGAERPSALARVVGAWKSHTTLAYCDGVLHAGWPRFDGQLWQRGFYDHVVRDTEDLERIRQYIRENPARWCVDRENPKPGL